MLKIRFPFTAWDAEVRCVCEYTLGNRLAHGECALQPRYPGATNALNDEVPFLPGETACECPTQMYPRSRDVLIHDGVLVST